MQKFDINQNSKADSRNTSFPLLHLKTSSLWKPAAGRGRDVGWLFLNASCQGNRNITTLFLRSTRHHFSPSSLPKETDPVWMYSLWLPAGSGQWWALAEDQRSGYSSFGIFPVRLPLVGLVKIIALLLWSAPSSTPFLYSNNLCLKAQGCQPLCFF